MCKGVGESVASGKSDQLPLKPAEPKDVWASGDAYEPYVGRWSRLIARQFIAWLRVPPDKTWLDVGCGTGSLLLLNVIFS
jgi:hypothetical protein